MNTGKAERPPAHQPAHSREKTQRQARKKNEKQYSYPSVLNLENVKIRNSTDKAVIRLYNKEHCQEREHEHTALPHYELIFIFQTAPPPCANIKTGLRKKLPADN